MKTGKNAQRPTFNTQRLSGTNFDVQRSTTNHPLVQGSGLRVQGSGFPHTPSTTNHTPSHPNSSFPTPNFSARTRAAFTLFELLAVITIIGIVLAVTLGSFTGWGDAQAVRGSVDVVEAALSQARDYAVARHLPVVFHYETDCCSTNAIRKTAAFMLATIDGHPLGTGTQRLPGSAWLTPESTIQTAAPNAEGQYVFLPDGTVTNAFSYSQTYRFFIISRKMRNSSANVPAIAYSVTIDPSSGTVNAERYDH